MSKKKEERQILFLTMLVTASVAINLSMILLIQIENAESPASAIIKTFTGNTPVEMFTQQVIQQTTTVRQPVPDEGTTIIPEPIPEPVPETKPIDELIKKLPVIVDEDVMPVPYAYYDYDKDGNIDLVRKEADGNYYVYKNKGTTEDKIFREGTKIENTEGSQLIENNAVKSTSSITTPAEVQAWDYISHPRYDLYIDTAYRAANPQIDAFFNEFDERFALLESTTGWSSEKNSVYGTKLRINVTASGACWGGNASLGYINVRLSDPLYTAFGGQCQKSYYQNGTLHLGNPGELGDNWGYMETTIHEALHGINPDSVIITTWLTEGFSRYYEYNTLSNYNGNGFTDINQETANTYLFLGSGSNTYNWTTYISNNYRDGLNLEIQNSLGYAITAWMFSMMRDNHALNWSNFYNQITNNREISDKATQIYLLTSSNLPSDMYIIDLFGKASGLNFSQIQTIWRYDSPSGPGWGVRNWTNLDWYADLTPTNLSFSKSNPLGGELVQAMANISNSGQTNANSVSVRFYATNTSGTTVLVKEQFVNFTSGTSKQINATLNSSLLNPKYGTHLISVKIDELNIKIETNELNNNYSRNITFAAPSGGSGCYYNPKYRFNPRTAPACN